MQREEVSAPAVMRIRIAIAAHEQALLLGFQALLEKIPDCEVVLAAQDGEQLLRELPALLPIHIVLVDVHHATCCGFHTIAQLREHFPETLPVALRRTDEEGTILRAHGAGACGQMLTTYGPAELERAVQRLMSTRRYLSDVAVQCVLDNTDGLTPFERKCAKARAALTSRHLEVVRAVCAPTEPTSGQVGELLNISPRTVDTHLTRIYSAVGVHSKPALTQWAIYHKIVDPVPPPPKQGKKR